VVLIAVLITVFCLFFACRDEKTGEEGASLNARLGELEKRLTRLEAEPERISLLEKRVKSLQQSVTVLEKSRAARLQAQTTKKKAVSSEKKRYHVVRQGEVLFKIAKQYGISVNELCRLNHITPKAVIRPGQKLLVGPGS
jgi:LysM repeat protein